MTRRLPLSQDALNEAAAVLRDGGLVAVPTETVYGLAADATNAEAVARIYEAKGRPGANPLIAHVANQDMARQFGHFSRTAEDMAAAQWPGPLTLVLPAVAPLAPAVTAGLPTVALRMPRGPMAQLASLLDRPLAAPSANRSGALSPTRAEHVVDGLADLVLDGGPCAAGLESTIVKVVGADATLLRQGPLSAADLAPFDVREAAPGAPVESPGTHFRHYAPRLPIRLNARQRNALEVLIAFGAPIDTLSPTIQLSAEADVTEAAHILFHALWQADRSGAAAIAVQPIPDHGIGAAINERLARAARG